MVVGCLFIKRSSRDAYLHGVVGAVRNYPENCYIHSLLTDCEDPCEPHAREMDLECLIERGAPKLGLSVPSRVPQCPAMVPFEGFFAKK